MLQAIFIVKWDKLVLLEMFQFKNSLAGNGWLLQYLSLRLRLEV